MVNYEQNILFSILYFISFYILFYLIHQLILQASFAHISIIFQ